MSVLTGNEILKSVSDGRITVDPFDPRCVGPNSLDLRLGSTLKIYVNHEGVPLGTIYNQGIKAYPFDGSERSLLKLREYLEANGGILDPKKPPNTMTVNIPSEGYLILPNCGYLGTTVETIGSDEFLASMHGRSSVGRLFVKPHYAAGLGDIGFKGQWTLEIATENPCILYAGMRICQLTFETVEGELWSYASRAMSKYNNQHDPVASKMFLDFDFS